MSLFERWIYWFSTVTPWLFQRARQLWWLIRHRVQAPKPEQGNCQSYREYRTCTGRQIRNLAVGELPKSWITCLLIDNSGSCRTVAKGHISHYTLLQQADVSLTQHDVAILAWALEQNPSSLCVYSDYEIRTRNEYNIVALPAASQRAWLDGIKLPIALLVRSESLSDLRLHERDLAPWSHWVMAVAERVPPGQIAHLPLPLGVTATLDRDPRSGTRRVAPLVQGGSLCVIIPTRDGGTILQKCVESIMPALLASNWDWEIIIVDNKSESPETLRIIDGLQDGFRIKSVNYPHEFNYSAINNFAANITNKEWLLLLNDDIEATDEHWLNRLLAETEWSDVGAIGIRLLYPGGRIQHDGIAIGLGGVAEHPGKGLRPEDPRLLSWAGTGVREVSAVTGACLLTHRGLYLSLGGLNEADLPVAFNDVDYCLRLSELGKRNLCVSSSYLIHHESISRGADNTLAKQNRFASEVRYMKTRWPAILKSDPFYSPHLSLHATDLSFRRPCSPFLARPRLSPLKSTLVR